METETWTVVRRKKKSKQPQSQTKIQVKLTPSKSIESASYLQATLDCLTAFPPFESIVCYGIGPLSNPISQRQFQLFIDIMKHFELDGFIYEPLFKKDDIDECRANGLKIIKENERGKRKVDKRTLFYMPHCPIGLYHNVLLANWETLDKIVVFGNSFSEYLSM
jgi:hypothetical protein